MSLDPRIRELVYGADAFARRDCSADVEFYRVDRFVDHLDARALATVSTIIAALVTEPSPRMLDLMASWDSHLPPALEPELIVGLGLNRRELAANPALDAALVHDLNLEPRLPFSDRAFDVVLTTVSVDYLVRPFEVFAEVARVLRAGGLHLVVFSNRYFQDKVVAVWRRASEPERLLIVEDYFASCELYGETDSFVSCWLPRPEDDRYAGRGLPSDPVWAERRGGPERPAGRRPPVIAAETAPDPPDLDLRLADVASTLRCPHCDSPLVRWRVPQTPFTEWDRDHFLICFSDRCPRYVRSFETMARQGIPGAGSRFLLDPVDGRTGSLPVPSYTALRDGIVDR